MYSNPDQLRFIESQLAAHQKHGFMTNDIVKLAWRQLPRVNGRPLKLSIHASTFLLLLAVWAMESPGDYFSTEDIVRELEKCEPRLGELNLSWANPTPADVHAAVSDLRRALRKSRLNSRLLESVRGKGYRLSTPAINIIADTPGAENLARLSPAPHRQLNGSETMRVLRAASPK